MKLLRYPKYKDSEADWLGEIPSHWITKPVWTLFQRSKRTGHEGEQLLSVYRDHGVVPKNSRGDNNNKPSDDLAPYQLVCPGDLAINKMKAWQGSVAISNHRGIVSPAYFVYVARHDEDGRYLHYLMRSPRYITGYLSISKGIRVNQWDLEPQYHSRLPVLLPPKAEQDTIASFLDRETVKIGALITEQEKLLALLAKKRQATISHAVTRGLKRADSMKDSGVRWLGEVPEHWRVTRCGRFLSILSGYAFPSSGFNHAGNGTKLLRGVNVSVSMLRWDDVVYWDRLPDDDLDGYELKIGDLVIGMDRPHIAAGVRVAKVKDEDVPCLLLQRVALLRTLPALNSDFLMHYLSTPMFVAHFSPDTTGVSVPHISPDQISSFVIAIPPIDEQRQIVEHIEHENAKLRLLCEQVERAIDLLKERRSTLINAAVTGKIDVRGVIQAKAA